MRQKYVEAYCDDSNVRTRAGRKQCEKVCENYFCCFDTGSVGYNCQEDRGMTCAAYSPCGTLLAEGMFDGTEGLDGWDALPLPRPLMRRPCPPDMVGGEDGFPPVEAVPGDPAPLPLPGDLTDDDVNDDVDGRDVPEYATKELCEMRADTDSAAATTGRPRGCCTER